MSCFNKISILTLACCYMALASVCVYGQGKTLRGTRQRQTVAVGFRSGRDILFNSPTLLPAKQTKVHYAISSTLVLSKPINKHLTIESGLRYSVIQNAANPFNRINDYTAPKKPFSISIPVTIQYYFLPEKSRVRPFIGAGMQSSFNTNSNNISPFSANTHLDYTDQTGTKYISILFTQGITFEINTKIQVNQSFHFIPETANKTFGIDIGIGFKLP